MPANNSFKNRIVMVLLVMAINSCSRPAYLSEADLMDYVMDGSNGLKKTEIVGNYKVESIFQPTDIMVSRELKFDKDNSKYDSLFKARWNKYADNYYFILSLEMNGKEALHQVGPSSYGEMVQILSFRMNEFVSLTSRADTLYVSDYILDRTYGLSNATNMLFAFKRGSFIEQEWIQFNVNEFGLGIGNVRFRYSMNDIKKVPRLRR